MTRISLPSAVEFAIELLGSDGGVVAGEHSAARNVRWANSALTTNGDSVERSLAVSAFVHSSAGVCNGLAVGKVDSRADVELLVAKARASATAAGPAADAMDLVEGPAHSDFDSAPEVHTALDAIAPALRVQFAESTSDYFGYAHESVDTSYVATSAGTRLRFTDSSARFELCAKSFDRTRSAWSGQGGTSLRAVDVAAHGEIVRQGLNEQGQLIDVEPGHHTVTLTPSAFSDLLIYTLWHATAREANEGRSVFSNPLGGTRIGERLTAKSLTVATDPMAHGIETHNTVVNLATSSGSSPFDTGMALNRTEIISDGVLRALAASRHEATQAQLPFTAFTDNIDVAVAGGSGNARDVASRMGDGLLITCLWYIREVDPQSLLLTGLTRDGVYVVRGGEIVGRAGNFRFNESPISMLDRIIDAGRSDLCLPREWADWFTRARSCAVTVDGFNLSTRSEAV